MAQYRAVPLMCAAEQYTFVQHAIQDEVMDGKLIRRVVCHMTSRSGLRNPAMFQNLNRVL
jgi:hypothetical protein